MLQLNLENNTITDPIVSGAQHILPRLPVAAVALLFGWVVIRLISWTGHFLIGFARLPRGLKSIIMSLLDAVLWIFLVIGILQVLGLNNIALAFSGGVVALGLAVGAGAQSLVGDILAGVFLAKDRDFSVGDLVKAGDDTEGVIESMDMRRTRIRDDKGQLHVLPNSVVERKEWVLVESHIERRTTK